MALVVWLPLNGNLENQGASSITVTNHNGTVDNSGKIGKCYLLNGTNAYINGIYNATTEMSFCCWANFPSIKSAHLFDARTSGGTGYQPMYVTASSIQIGASGSNYANFSQTFSNNTWYHICVTHNGAEGKCYINGTLIGTSTAAKGANMGTCVFTLGSRCNQSNYQNAKINDVRIYNHCLSAAEVHEISQGLVLHYKLDDTIGFTDLITRGTTWTIYNNHNNTNMPSTLVDTGNMYNGDKVYRETCTPTDNSINSIRTSLGSHGIYNWHRTFTANTKYVFWIYYKPISHPDTRCGGTASNIGGWTEIPPVEVGGGWYRVGAYRNGTVTTDKTDNIFVSFKVPSATTGTPIIIDWASPHLIEGTTEIPSYDYASTTITDSSGYGHNGSITGNLTVINDTPRYESAINYSNSYIDTPLEITTIDSTISMWLNIPSLSTSYHILDGRNSGGTGKQPIYSYSNGSIQSGGSSAYVTSNTGFLETNKWIFIALVQSGNSLLLYKNGILFQTISCTNTPIIKPTIGARYSHSNIYTGKMSDFRIYATALSAADVKQLYELGGKIDNKQNLHVYEGIESSSAMKLTKSGQMKVGTFIEDIATKFNKTDLIVETNNLIEI